MKLEFKCHWSRDGQRGSQPLLTSRSWVRYPSHPRHRVPRNGPEILAVHRSLSLVVLGHLSNDTPPCHCLDV